MTGHYCTGENCGHCQHRITAAEDGPVFDPNAADREADRYYESLQNGRAW